MPLDTADDPIAWDRLDAFKHQDEAQAVAELLKRQPLGEARAAVRDEAEALVVAARRSVQKQGVVESFLQEFSLGTREGLVLMSLAEALLRTPDCGDPRRPDREKISSADWASHLGQSENLFVNASTWGLMLTGQIVDVDDDAKRDLPGFLKRGGQPGGRAGDPRGGGPGDPHHGRAVRARPQHRGGAEALAQGRLPLLLRHAGGGRAHRVRRRALREGLCRRHRSGRAARRKAAGPEVGHGISVKLSALSRDTRPRTRRGSGKSSIRG
jgi:RHH-type proline utilization regulon transcriptional repressor/proline dehydrogenase/delta 1-pyrroline-5-carboxylate dehydrogenase